MTTQTPDEPGTADDLTVEVDTSAVDVTIDDWDGDPAPEGSEDDCDGAEDDTLEAVVPSASSRGWGAGWPSCQTSRLSTVTVGGGIRLSVRKEIAPLVAWLCAQSVARGYPLRSGQCWGFACRPIRGTSTASNHSWGLAVDLNSLANPMGSRLVTDMPAWMPRLWSSHGFRWGGSYAGRKDAMHYEYIRTPAAAAATVAALRPATAARPATSATPAAGRAKATPVARAAPRAAAPGVAAPAFPLPSGHYYGLEDSPRCHTGRSAADRPNVRRFQARMIERGWDLGPEGADGFVGFTTRDAVKAFQKEKGLQQDARVGPTTWRAIWQAPVTR